MRFCKRVREGGSAWRTKRFIGNLRFLGQLAGQILSDGADLGERQTDALHTHGAAQQGEADILRRHLPQDCAVRSLGYASVMANCTALLEQRLSLFVRRGYFLPGSSQAGGCKREQEEGQSRSKTKDVRRISHVELSPWRNENVFWEASCVYGKHRNQSQGKCAQRFLFDVGFKSCDERLRLSHRHDVPPLKEAN